MRKEGTHFLRETRELVSYSEKREKVLSEKKEESDEMETKRKYVMRWR